MGIEMGDIFLFVPFDVDYEIAEVFLFNSNCVVPMIVFTVSF